MSLFVKVATLDELTENEGKCVEVQDRRIALFRVDDQIYALEDECTHEEAPLSNGTVEAGEVVCPWHGACFNLRTGECTAPPADEAVKSYPVRVNGQDVEIAV